MCTLFSAYMHLNYKENNFYNNNKVTLEVFSLKKFYSLLKFE